jgi:head-tail adaptor
MSDVITNNVTATEQTGAVNPADAIAAMIAANKRNVPQVDSTAPPAGQAEAQAQAPEAAPDEEAEPEDSSIETTETVDAENEEEATDGVTEPVNFLEFAEQNPDMLWRIPNKDAEGGFVEIPVSKAAAILGQGSAIHENARKLKAERADFEEYEANRRKELDGLQIGLELTIQPKLQEYADELITLQQYNQQWAQIRDAATDEVQRSEAEAAIRQNAKLIQEKSEFITTNRPKVEQFYQHRSAFVQEQLERARQSFTDKELANKATFSELRDKLSKDWKGASGSFVPGVPNIDLVSSDEYLLGLIRDGMKFREGPKVRNAGGSLAAANQPKAKAKTSQDTKAEELQKKAASGDKGATRDLLATFLASQKRRPR